MVDCYTCKHVGKVIGSAHVSCQHPATKGKAIILMLAVVSDMHFDTMEFNRYGVEKGWCNWPLEFDPLWIIRCDARSE